jgi:hypothetical protein
VVVGEKRRCLAAVKPMSTQDARCAALVLITAGCSVVRGYQSGDSIRGIFSVVSYLPVGSNPVILRSIGCLIPRPRMWTLRIVFHGVLRLTSGR